MKELIESINIYHVVIAIIGLIGLLAKLYFKWKMRDYPLIENKDGSKKYR